MFTIQNTGLNILLRVAYNYSANWLLDVSIEKTVVMVWGKGREPNVLVCLGDEEITGVR